MLKRFCSAMIAGIVLAACSESSVPTNVVPVPAAAVPAPLGPGEAVVAQLTCTVTGAAMSCAPAGLAAVPGRSADLIFGGIYVKLTSTNVDPNANDTTYADVTVKNLLGQPWNTVDGISPDTGGVRVFFATGPTNGVIVANPTGSQMFTASNQPYYKYFTELGVDNMLTPTEVSAPIQWKFKRNGQASFSFGVSVVTRMPDETGPMRYFRDTLTKTAASEYRTSVWGSSPTDVWVGGTTATTTGVHRWNGTTWSDAGMNIGTILGIWGAAANDVYFVGSQIIRHNGTTFTLGLNNPGGTLLAIWGSSASNIYAVGNGGLVWQGSGTIWNSIPTSTTGMAGTTIKAVWGSGPSDVYFGTLAHGVFHFDGSNWTSKSSGLSGVNAIWGSSASDVWMGGANGGLTHWNGTSWATVTTPGGPSTIQGMWGSSANNVYFVNANGEIWHFDGTSWARPKTNTTPGVDLLAIWGSGQNLFAAGASGTPGSLINVVVRGIR